MKQEEILKQVSILWDYKSQQPEKYKLLEDYGEIMFKMFTQHGLPADITKDIMKKKMKFTKEELLIVVSKYLGLFTLHRIDNGMEIDGAQHKKAQDRNNEICKKVLETGDFNSI